MTTPELEYQLFELICSNPGVHFRGLLKLVSREVGVVNYHLQHLMRQGSVFSLGHQGRVLYFDHTWKPRAHQVKLVISSLRKAKPREILLFLAADPAHQQLSMKELATSLMVSPSTLSWHVKRLIEDELVQPVRFQKNITLKLQVDIDLLNQLGREIFPSRWDLFLDRIDEKFSR